MNIINNNDVDKEEEFLDLPLDIFDIIEVCDLYSVMGNSIQNQIKTILEIGLDEALKTNQSTIKSLNNISFFLERIKNNGYFGDAASQANDVHRLLNKYLKDNPIKQENFN